MKNKRVWVLLGILVGLCFWTNYYNTHLDKIYTLKAENAFKRNNITMALDYLEKAFDLGLEDSKYRDMYLNTILTSPFDDKAQERIIKFIEYSIDDMAYLKAKYFIKDFKREIDIKYPYNYITQAPYNQKIMRWCKNPITYGFINTKNVPDYFITEIESAFSRIEDAVDRQFLFLRDNNNPNIIVNFKDSNPAASDSKKYIVAYTTPEINANTLKNSTINFYLKNPNNKYYTPNQVYNTALHEIIHAIGVMGHSSDKQDIMHYTKDTEVIVNDLKDDLTIADINTIKLLYNIKPDITNTENPKGKYIPYIALGSAEIMQNAKMQEAVNYTQKAPKMASGYMDLAESYLAKKDYVNAEKCLKKAFKLAESDETKSMIYFNIAVVNFYSGDYINAEKYLLASMKIKDSNDSHCLLAEIYSKNNIPKAIGEYKKLISKEPQNIDYTIGLTNIYIKEKKYFKARNVLKNFYKHNPNERNNKRFESYGILTMFL